MGSHGIDPGAPARQSACKVLVVDDNVDSAQSMSLLLGLEGYSVECAYDGEEALVRAGTFVPEVVLLDLGLPRISGYEVAQRLRAAAEAERRPLLLVAVSGYGRDQDRRAAREAGFDLHLTKPADPDEVLRVLAARHLRTGAMSPRAGGGPDAQSSDPGAPAQGTSRAAGHGQQPSQPDADAAPNA